MDQMSRYRQTMKRLKADIDKREAKGLKLHGGKVSTKSVREIDWDTWADSGGTAGIYAEGVKKGRIKII